MLVDLLKVLRSGGVHALSDVARELSVSEALVQTMVDELVRLGYLKPAAQACPGSCEACPLASCCALGTMGRLWTLTDAGRRLLQPSDSEG